MMTLLLVRHGETDWNKAGRYQGHSDIPLNDFGQNQASQLAERLASEKLHVILSSDLSRAIQTAEAIASHHKLSIGAEPRLREANFGIFEGLRYKDVIDQHPKMAEGWFSDPECPPQDGEKLSEVAGRVRALLDEILASYPRKRLLLVGHDGALRLLLCHLLDLPYTEYWRFNMDTASLSRVNVYDGGAILIRLNDIGHLTS